MQLESVCTVSVRRLLCHILGQIDDHDRIKGAFLHTAQNHTQKQYFSQIVGFASWLSCRDLIANTQSCKLSVNCASYLDTDSTSNAELLRNPGQLRGWHHLYAQLACANDQPSLCTSTTIVLVHLHRVHTPSASNERYLRTNLDDRAAFLAFLPAFLRLAPTDGSGQIHQYSFLTMRRRS